MFSRTRFRMGIVAFATVLLLVVAAACTDDDDREPGAPAGTGDGTPAADFGVPTPGPDDEDEDPVSEGTPEHDYSGVEREPGERLTPEATPPDADSTPVVPLPGTPPPDPLAERTVTPDSDAVGPQDEGMFPDLRAEGPNYDNFTLTIAGELEPTPPDADTDSPARIDLRYAQAAPDEYHLLFDGDDEFVVEVWSIGDQFWIRENGDEVREDDGQMAEDFDISAYLTMLPEIERIADAEEAGQEEIEGRMTTRYTVPAADAVQYMPGMRDAAVHDAEGAIDIWLDEEENAVLRMTVDLRWLDDDENENTADLEYEVTSIDETADIEIPQE